MRSHRSPRHVSRKDSSFEVNPMELPPPVPLISNVPSFLFTAELKVCEESALIRTVILTFTILSTPHTHTDCPIITHNHCPAPFCSYGNNHLLFPLLVCYTQTTWFRLVHFCCWTKGEELALSSCCWGDSDGGCGLEVRL